MTTSPDELINSLKEENSNSAFMHPAFPNERFKHESDYLIDQCVSDDIPWKVERDNDSSPFYDNWKNVVHFLNSAKEDRTLYIHDDFDILMIRHSRSDRGDGETYPSFEAVKTAINYIDERTERIDTEKYMEGPYTGTDLDEDDTRFANAAVRNDAVLVTYDSDFLEYRDTGLKVTNPFNAFK